MKKEPESATANENVGKQGAAGGSGGGRDDPSAAGAGSPSKGDKRWGGSQYVGSHCMQVVSRFVEVLSLIHI